METKTPRPAAKAYGRSAGQFIANLVDKLESRIDELEKEVAELADEHAQRLAELETLSNHNENRLYELGDVATEIADLKNELAEMGEDE